MAIAGVLIAVALVSLVIFKIVTSGSAGDTGSYTGQARAAELKNVSADFGIAVDKDGQAIAAPDENLANVGVFSDLMCPHCVSLDHASRADYEKYLSEGKIQIVEYPVQIMGTDYSKYGNAALFYVATYAPEHFSKFHAALFERSYKIIVERSGQMPTAAEIADIAKGVGVPEDVVNDLPASIISADWQKKVEAATEKFREAGWTGTPTVTINGTEDKSWGEGSLGAAFANAVKAGPKSSAAAK
ncbi:thioredoxin domain-containing protein [Arcanobacterium hippocoleae]